MSSLFTFSVIKWYIDAEEDSRNVFAYGDASHIKPHMFSEYVASSKD